MTVSGSRIQDLVMRMQSEFLETPGLTLTPDAAERRFGVDETTCDAVLTVLVEANVLTRNPGGAYARFFPRPHQRGRRQSSRRQRPAVRPAGISGHSTHAA